MLQTTTSNRSLEDIVKYAKKATEEIEERFKGKENHPNHIKLKRLLLDQLEDEFYDQSHTLTNWWTVQAWKRSY